MSTFCVEHGISRKSFYELRKRARDDGQAAVLEPRSRRPKSSPTTLTDQVKAQAVQVRAALARIFRQAGVARAEPKKKIKLPKLARSEPVPLTHAQLWSLVKAVSDERDKVLILVLGYGGMRWSEVVALRISDVKDGGRRLCLSEAAVQVGGRIETGTLKDHEARTVILPQIVADRLKKWTKDRSLDALVFASSHGTYMHNQNWRRDVLTPAADSLGLTITPHNL
ncbi:MAG: tyrosine-type recombinase/integrase, partial [Propionicimonas sp.]|nr:tyrosine-type recombinase/integrase [Propionicimonas sp.]